MNRTPKNLDIIKVWKENYEKREREREKKGSMTYTFCVHFCLFMCLHDVLKENIGELRRKEKLYTK